MYFLHRNNNFDERNVKRTKKMKKKSHVIIYRETQLKTLPKWKTYSPLKKIEFVT